MNIGKTIAFSFFLHTLFFFAALLSVRHIISGERIFLVELTVNPETGQALNRGNDIKTAKNNLHEKPYKKKETAIPSQEQKQYFGDDMKVMREEDSHKTGATRPFYAEALEGLDFLSGVTDKSVYGLEESHPLPLPGASVEIPPGNSSGEKGVYHSGGETNNRSLVNQIWASIEKAKIYPELARKRKQEGTVVTEFYISSKGMPENIKIMRSSGYSILDSAARDTIARAAPFPVVKITVEVPITFNLK